MTNFYGQYIGFGQHIQTPPPVHYHDGLNYVDLVDNSRLVVDTRNAIDNKTVDMEKVQKA